MKKVFIDGRAGTTGLRIYERLAARADIQMLTLPEERRKDPGARREMLNRADVVFLCLPDDAAREAVQMIEGNQTVVLDTSTAHRTAPGWCYGFPELSSAQAEAIRSAKRIAVPGCHASGFIALVAPLIQAGILPKEALFSCHSVTGYSGGGKKMIAEYEGRNPPALLGAPRQYALGQSHKHLKEMTALSGLAVPPVFCPIVADFYSGMAVTVPVFRQQLGAGANIKTEGDNFMKVLEGKSVFSGIAIGKISILQKVDASVKRVHVEDPEEEVKRVEAAREQAVAQLQKLYDKALQEVGESGAAIFEVHQMMLDDDDYLDSIHNIIRTESVNAEYAVATTGDNFSSMFAQMDDDYMKARAADVKDISDRLVRVLSGHGDGELEASEPVIVVAEDLAPSETVQMDKSKVLAFVTRKGSSNSHTAILARTMNIPALINIEYDESMDGKMAVVDGKSGNLIVEPDAETLKKYEDMRADELAQRAMLKELKGKETVTKSGRKLHLYANIGSTGDVANVLANDAEGIGLFRSEFVYLEKEDYPTEEEQFQVYKTVAQNMAGKKVIIRTLDIGADKQIDYFNMAHEENPAMGYRAIRICLDRPEVFKTQLRALFRASMFGNISIMYPMIISVTEVKQIKAIVAEVKAELKEQGIPFRDDVEQGIMIETPAAVMISDLLAKEVDFFSIGTNDLTQYTLAIDRQNAKLDNIYDSHHEAVLRMIQMVVDNAHKEGIWAGICGELGADTTLTERFVEMGLDELSVSPTFVLPVRKIVREMK